MPPPNRSLHAQGQDEPGSADRSTALAEGRASVVLTDRRTRQLLTMPLFAGVGLMATTGIICVAVALRSPADVAALERGKEPSSAAPASTPSEPRETAPSPTGSAAAPERHADAASPPGGGSASASAGTMPTDAPPAQATAAELEDARTAGIAALVALAQRYPNDTAVLKAVALAHGRERAYGAAVQQLKRVLELEPEEAANDELRQLILRSANATPEVADAALMLMAQNMGGRGPDLLYEVVTAPKFGNYPREAASKLLLDEGVRALASPALLIADELRRLSGCPSKALIAKTRDQGDARALHYLNPLLKPHRCGVFGLRNCLKCGPVLKDARVAVKAIEKRREAAASSAPPASSRR